MSGEDWTGLTVLPGNDDWMPHPDPEMRGIGHPDFVEHVAYVRFDPATGRITERGTMARAHVMRQRMQGGIVPGIGRPETHYVDLFGGVPAVMPKTPCPAKLKGLTLSRLPVPCEIEISNPGGDAPTVYPCADRKLTLAFDHPATWTVRILSERHHPVEFTITT